MSAHKAVNCVALHGENLKMGKDVRGIERGKCACGECEDFMRSDGATCGCCGCLPTCHSKKDARYSSDSVGSTLGAGTSESPEKWKDEEARVAQVTNRHRRLIFYQDPTRKHYRRQNMDESGHGSRETIMLVGTR